MSLYILQIKAEFILCNIFPSREGVKGRPLDNDGKHCKDEYTRAEVEELSFSVSPYLFLFVFVFLL